MTAVPGPTPLTYDSYIKNLAVLAVINTETVGGSTRAVDPNFNQIVPQMINYAELRIQRDLDLMPLQTTNDSYLLTLGNNILQVSVNDFVTVQNILVVNGTVKKRMLPVSKEFIQEVYPDSDAKGIPKFFAPYGGDAATSGNQWMNFLVGPNPDQNYSVSIVGSTRMSSLAWFANSPQSAIGTTFISTFLPDLLLMASMVYISGYQRNFSAASDDPNMAVNYEKQYQTLLKGAMGEELRKRFRASAWSSEAPSPAATPVRA
jgi:hypothetical protein